MKDQNDYLVIGHFKFVDDTLKGIKRLKEMGHGEMELFSPVPNHELEDEIYKGKPRSPVRMFTLLGGLTGLCGAFLMTIWMSLDYPVRVSAKPLVSIPAFVVIGFECTILLGGIFTLLGLLHNCKLPDLLSGSKFREGYRGVFTRDVFGLVARVPKDKTEGIKQVLNQCGAHEVEVQYVR